MFNFRKVPVCAQRKRRQASPDGGSARRDLRCRGSDLIAKINVEKVANLCEKEFRKTFLKIGG